MMDIALHGERGPVILRDIARRQNISEKYLWQVINPLRSAGLVNSVRGAHGGYVLARPAEEITVRDIVSVLEGPVSVVACVTSPESCERSAACTAREAWSEIETKVNEAMRGISLKDLAKKQQDKENRVDLSYVI